jgi:hypothetical protein
MDLETKTLLTEQEKIARFVKGEDYQIIKARISEKIFDLQSVMNVAGGTAEQIVIDMKSRRMAVETLYAVLADIEGTAAQYEANALLVEDPNDYVVRS